MKNLNKIFWILFFVSLVVLRLQHRYVVGKAGNFDIIGLELANKVEGADLLNEWHFTPVDEGSLIDASQVNTIIDFFFILGYVGAIIMVSYHLMQLQKNRIINEALRTTFFLAVVAGVLDAVENIILLVDMHRYRPGNEFYSAMYFAWPKFILIAVIGIIWILHFSSKIFRTRESVRQ